MSQSFWQFLSPEPGTNRTAPKGKNPDGNAKGGPMKDPLRFNIGYAIATMIGVLILQYLIGTAREIATIPYSQFEQLLKDGKVAEIGISNRFIQGKLREPLDGKSKFVTTRVDPDFAQELQKYNVRYNGIIDPPPLKWSALRYGFRAKEDHDAEEEKQARGDCCEAAPGGCAGVAGAERCRNGTLDWGYGGHVLPLAPGVWRAQVIGPR